MLPGSPSGGAVSRRLTERAVLLAVNTSSFAAIFDGFGSFEPKRRPCLGRRIKFDGSVALVQQIPSRRASARCIIFALQKHHCARHAQHHFRASENIISAYPLRPRFARPALPKGEPRAAPCMSLRTHLPVPPPWLPLWGSCQPERLTERAGSSHRSRSERHHSPLCGRYHFRAAKTSLRA